MKRKQLLESLEFLQEAAEAHAETPPSAYGDAMRKRVSAAREALEKALPTDAEQLMLDMLRSDVCVELDFGQWHMKKRPARGRRS